MTAVAQKYAYQHKSGGDLDITGSDWELFSITIFTHNLNTMETIYNNMIPAACFIKAVNPSLAKQPLSL